MLPAIGLVEIGVAGFDGQLAAVRHGVAGVDGEVDDGGLQLGGVGLDRPDAAAPTISSEMSSPSARFRKSASPFSSRLTSSALGLSGCCRENASSRLVSMAARWAPASHCRCGGPACTFAPSVQDFNLLLRVLEIADDDGQEIVEVMSHPAGEMADRFEPLRLPERFFGGDAASISS